MSLLPDITSVCLTSHCQGQHWLTNNKPGYSLPVKINVCYTKRNETFIIHSWLRLLLSALPVEWLSLAFLWPPNNFYILKPRRWLNDTGLNTNSNSWNTTMYVVQLTLVPLPRKRSRWENWFMSLVELKALSLTTMPEEKLFCNALEDTTHSWRTTNIIFNMET